MIKDFSQHTVREPITACLILAAGRGSRLSCAGAPKPLLPLLGLTLIERTILTAKQAGLNDFYVVTGYEGEKVQDFLSDLSRWRNVQITVISNPEWETASNGLSVLKAAKFLKKNFIMLMVDHIFDEAMLIDFMKQPVVQDGIILATDFNIRENKRIDIGDVTKVSVEDYAILDIGKEIKQYNGYDTGMFLCTPAIFQTVKESIQKGDTSLTGAVKRLAHKGKARVFDIKDYYWMDIDTTRDVKKAKKLLYGTLTKPLDGWISRKINRKFPTRLFTPLILKLFGRITPNIVSLVSFEVGVIASLVFFLKLSVVGGILVQLSSILDGSDGEIARLKKM